MKRMSQQVYDLRKTYKPFLEQESFHKGYQNYWARLVSAGTGGGKTKCGLAEAYQWTIDYPGSWGILFEPTYGMLQRILLREAIPAYFGCSLESWPEVVDFNKTKLYVDWVNGSHWELMGLDEPERAEGVSVDWIWADEFRLVGGSGPSAKRKQETAWKVFIRRLRGSAYGRLNNYPTGLWITTTPDSPGSVTYQHFENPEKKVVSSHVYRWSIDANIHLTDQYITEVKRAHIPGTGLYNRFVLGLFATVSAGSYPYDSTIHETKDYLLKTRIKQMVYGVDWGWTNPCCLLAIALDYDSRAYISEEFYQSRVSLETIIQSAQDMETRWGKGIWVCGHEEPRSIQKFRDAGINAVANKSKRNEGILEMGGRFHKAGDDRPRIYVHKSCVNWISEVQSYNSDVKQGDHAMDATRYALTTDKTVQAGWAIG